MTTVPRKDFALYVSERYALLQALAPQPPNGMGLVHVSAYRRHSKTKKAHAQLIGERKTTFGFATMALNF